MYVRAKTVRHGDKAYEYLQLVEARREAGRNRQRVIATLGRLDQVSASGQLDRLIAGLARFSEHLRVVRGGARGRARRAHRKELGTGRWYSAGCGHVRGCPASSGGSRRTASSASTSSGSPSRWPCSD